MFLQRSQKPGGKYPAYFLWHPYDHIAVNIAPELNVLKAGAPLHIQECFQGDPKWLLDAKTKIFYFSRDGFGINSHVFGLPVFSLLHNFQNTADGVQYNSRMLLGLNKGILRPMINNLFLPKKFGKDRARAWLKHNIEEVGCFENFLSDIYVRRDQGRHINLDE